MSKPLPCKRCGTATLKTATGKTPYVMGVAPSAFRTRGQEFAYSCSCGAKMSLSKLEFYALKDVA